MPVSSASDILIPHSALIKSGAIYEDKYLLGTAIARPLQAYCQVAYARELGARCVAHGCTGKGNDQIRFELAYRALAPDLEIIAPWRVWNIRSREEAIDYAHTRGIPLGPITKKKHILTGRKYMAYKSRRRRARKYMECSR